MSAAEICSLVTYSVIDFDKLKKKGRRQKTEEKTEMGATTT
jgi:hypothetical protein